MFTRKSYRTFYHLIPGSTKLAERDTPNDLDGTLGVHEDKHKAFADGFFSLHNISNVLATKWKSAGYLDPVRPATTLEFRLNTPPDTRTSTIARQVEGVRKLVLRVHDYRQITTLDQHGWFQPSFSGIGVE